jgi:hypothetical protein
LLTARLCNQEADGRMSAGKHVKSDPSGSQNTAFNPGAGRSAGPSNAGGGARLSAVRHPTPMSSRDSGTGTPDIAGETSSSAGGGRSINQDDCRGFRLQHMSLPAMGGSMWRGQSTAPVLHALPHGLPPNLLHAAGRGHHLTPPTFGAVASRLQLPMSGRGQLAPGVHIMPVEGDSWVDTRTVNHLLGLGVPPGPSPAATAVGAYAMPVTGMLRPFSPNAATTVWNPQGATQAGWGAGRPPAAVPFVQVLPAHVGPGIPRGPPDSLLGCSMRPQPVASVPLQASVPNYVPGPTSVAQGVVNAQLVASQLPQPAAAWNPLNVSPSSGATAGKLVDPGKGGGLKVCLPITRAFRSYRS